MMRMFRYYAVIHGEVIPKVICLNDTIFSGTDNHDIEIFVESPEFNEFCSSNGIEIETSKHVVHVTEMTVHTAKLVFPSEECYTMFVMQYGGQ